ncbi:hypothetical protein NQ317_018341 [Molorchus minor]|uniref:DNA replication factor Cdt1 C-terminal domain-containing protein n=1 Tax=Molorchus minor TaxID=1323400 RepID=A0ABQ9J6Y7_9CUCU|nr:hypothetical protein NQ317_018341 [Molorchus minor]
MEQALQKLQQSRENFTLVKEEKIDRNAASSKNQIIIFVKTVDVKFKAPVVYQKLYFEKVRQKQATKALMSMTRSADKEKELLTTRVSPLYKKSFCIREKVCFTFLDIVVEIVLGKCYRGNLTKTEMEEHLKTVQPSSITMAQVQETNDDKQLNPLFVREILLLYAMGERNISKCLDKSTQHSALT